MHIAVVILHIVFLGLQQNGLDSILTEELDEWRILRQTPWQNGRGPKLLLLIPSLLSGLHQFLSLRQIIGSHRTPQLHKFFNLADRVPPNRWSSP